MYIYVYKHIQNAHPLLNVLSSDKIPTQIGLFVHVLQIKYITHHRLIML